MSFLILVVKKIDNQTNKIVFKYIFNNKKIIKKSIKEDLSAISEKIQNQNEKNCSTKHIKSSNIIKNY